MTDIPPEFAFLLQWAESTDPVLRLHAANRIAMGFDHSPSAPPASSAPTPADDAGRAALLARVVACPHRGPSLPVSEQPECGCRELYECRAGKGARPGRATTADCLECQSQLI